MESTDVIGLVFDMPDEAWTSEIRRLRLAYDPGRSHFPVEITVAGSSGLGWFSPKQTLGAIAAQVRGIAKTVPPFQFLFSRVEVFREPQVYYLAVGDEEPFHTFQRALVASELQFEAAKFSYKPHCTIAALSKGVTAAVRRELLAFPVPDHAIAIGSVSLYAVNFSTNECRFVIRFPLGA